MRRASTTTLLADGWSRATRLPTVVVAGLYAVIVVALGRLTVVSASSFSSAAMFVPTVEAFLASGMWALIIGWLLASVAAWLAVAWLAGALAAATVMPELGTLGALSAPRRRVARVVLLQLVLSASTVVAELALRGTLRGLVVIAYPDWLWQAGAFLESLVVAVVLLGVWFSLRDVVIADARPSLAGSWALVRRYWWPALASALIGGGVMFLLIAIAFALGPLIGRAITPGSPVTTAIAYVMIWPQAAFTAGVVSACWLESRAPKDGLGADTEEDR